MRNQDKRDRRGRGHSYVIYIGAILAVLQLRKSKHLSPVQHDNHRLVFDSTESQAVSCGAVETRAKPLVKPALLCSDRQPEKRLCEWRNRSKPS